MKDSIINCQIVCTAQLCIIQFIKLDSHALYISVLDTSNFASYKVRTVPLLQKIKTKVINTESSVDVHDSNSFV